jgi:hypothetical protein
VSQGDDEAVPSPVGLDLRRIRRRQNPLGVEEFADDVAPIGDVLQDGLIRARNVECLKDASTEQKAIPCAHYDYQATVVVTAPNGSQANSTQWGMQSNVAMATNGVMGNYWVAGTAALYCSCGGPLGAEGSGTSVPVTPTVAITGGNNYVLYGSDQNALSCNLVQATGTPSGGQYAWSVNNPSRVSITDTGNPGVAQLQAINPSTSVNDTVLTVNYTYNGVAAAPATKSTTVTIYRYLTQAGSYNPIGLSPPNYGYYGYVYYNVFAQPGQFPVRAGGLPTYETVSQVSLTPSDFAGSVTVRQGEGATDSNGQIIDQLGVICSCQLPPNLQIVDNQDLAVEGIYVRNNTLTFSNSTVTIGNNGPYQ